MMKNDRSRTGMMQALLVLLLCLAPAPVFAEEIQGVVLPFQQVTVSSPVQEIIRRIHVEEGATVEEGQVLATLVSDKEAIEVQQYEKLVERREFQAQGAETLYAEKMTSKESALEKRTELELARLQHKLALTRFEEKTIRSPLNGIVVKKHKESGEAVDRVEDILDVVNIDKVYVQFYLDPRYLGLLHEGDSVPVRFASMPGKAQEVAGIISFIDPRLDAASGLFRVKLLVDNPGHRIKAGMRATGEFAPPPQPEPGEG